MMLHGIEQPNIIRVNTLETKLSDIQENLQHDIVITNPPFGGEENDSIKKKLPAEFQTKDTALGFLLHCITRLKDGGKCGIILPNGPLFSAGIAGKIKQKLLEECNLHTIIRLPKGIFSPYTNISTNILFFEKTESTKEIWYYELPPRSDIPFGKKNPIQFEEFKECLDWMKKPTKTKNSWKINVKKIIDNNYDLDERNPDITEYNDISEPKDLLNKIDKNLKKLNDNLIKLKEFLK